MSTTEIDENELDRILAERDYWEELAAKLANAVGKHFDREVGEHSSANCPVLTALEILEDEAQ